MRTYDVKKARYFELRKRYETAREIAELINRSDNYVKQRMTVGNKDFTDREKRILNIQEVKACQEMKSI